MVTGVTILKTKRFIKWLLAAQSIYLSYRRLVYVIYLLASDLRLWPVEVEVKRQGGGTSAEQKLELQKVLFTV